jgi:hypothetical protein
VLVRVRVRAWVLVQVLVQVLVLAWEQMGPWISRRASLHPPRTLSLCSNRPGRTSDARPHHTHPFPCANCRVFELKKQASHTILEGVQVAEERLSKVEELAEIIQVRSWLGCAVGLL